MRRPHRERSGGAGRRAAPGAPHHRFRTALLGVLATWVLVACSASGSGADAGPPTAVSASTVVPGASSAPAVPERSAPATASDPADTAGPDADVGPASSEPADNGGQTENGVPPSAGTPTPGPPMVPHGQGLEPTALSVPDIGVQEDLIHLGINDDGTAEVPADYARVGWFAGGGRPGGVGPTVLLGHVDSLDGPAVFYRLRELQVGALVTVSLADGSEARYQVVSTAQYSKAEFPTIDVYGATPRDVLTLITCGGPFDTDALSYTDNVVVTADRVA